MSIISSYDVISTCFHTYIRILMQDLLRYTLMFLYASCKHFYEPYIVFLIVFKVILRACQSYLRHYVYVFSCIYTYFIARSSTLYINVFIRYM